MIDNNMSAQGQNPLMNQSIVVDVNQLPSNINDAINDLTNYSSVTVKFGFEGSIIAGQSYH